jgi:hypothetical protein
MTEKEKIAIPPRQRTETDGATWPASAVPEAFRTLAGKQVVQGKDTLDALSTAAQDACSTNIKMLNDYSQSFMRAGQRNADSAFDYWRDLIAAKSLSELIDIWSSHAPRQFNSASDPTSDLWAHYYKMANAATKPIANGTPHPHQGST